MSSKKYYLLYAVTASGAFAVALGICKSTQWPGWDPTNGSDFEHAFDWFWRDENGKVPIFIASHLVGFFKFN